MDVFCRFTIKGSINGFSLAQFASLPFIGCILIQVLKLFWVGAYVRAINPNLWMLGFDSLCRYHLEDLFIISDSLDKGKVLSFYSHNSANIHSFKYHIMHYPNLLSLGYVYMYCVLYRQHIHNKANVSIYRTCAPASCELTHLLKSNKRLSELILAHTYFFCFIRLYSLQHYEVQNNLYT